MKKTLAVLLTLALVLMSACGSTTSSTSSTASDPASSTPAGSSSESPDLQVTLEIQIVQTDWSDAWDEMEDRFETEYPGIDVVNVGLGEDGVTFLTARAAANDLPAMIQVDNNTTCRNLVDDGQILDLSNRPGAANIPESYREAFIYNDTLFGLTQGSAFSVLYLNMAILKEAGWDTAPTNWAEMIQCCKDIQANTDAAPLTLAGDKTTTCWMLYECILANVCGNELGFGVFEEQFKDGTLDFSSYSQATEMLAEITPYILTGTASMTEDDVTAAFADGNVAMAIAGNWTATNICDAINTQAGSDDAAVAILPPFNAEGVAPWISVSPETAFGMTKQDDPDVARAAEIFFDWVFEAENFAIIQNARGTVPVLTTMTDDQIKLPAAISVIVSDMNAAKYVKMGFNLWTEEFRDSACTSLRDVYAGNMTAEAAAASMSALLQKSFANA